MRHKMNSVKRTLILRDSSEDKIVYEDSTAVDTVLGQLNTLLTPLRGEGTGVDSNVTSFDVESKFQQLLATVRSSSISENTKREIYAESSMMIQDSMNRMSQNEQDKGYETADMKGRNIAVERPKTAVYSPSTGPVLIVYGTGKVGQRVVEIANELGKAADFRFINASLLSTMQESEINFAVRNIKSVIIASDSAAIEKKGWFGQVDTEQPPDLINAKGLKRLLNAARKDLKESKDEKKIKIVALGRACKQKKSVGAFLGGDNTDLESEIILQCQQRGLKYNIVQVGQIIEDNDSIADNVRTRSIYNDEAPETDEFAREIYEPPFVFTRSKIVESSECTRLTTAAEALMRFTVHPHENATISVLSNPLATSDYTSEQMPDSVWQDEMLKVDGPELLRYPLRYASMRQANRKVKKIIDTLKEPKSGLITPIEVETYDNGIRVLFRPLTSDYISSKDEKLLLEQAKAAEMASGSTTFKNTKRPSGYLSPEEEKRIAAQLAAAEEAKQPGANSKSEKEKSKKKQSPEGGLDIIIEESPFMRVRARRCNMGPKTIVKLESEGLIIKSLQRGLRQLDNDYRMLASQFDTIE